MQAFNYTTTLQELCQKLSWPLPRYADDPLLPSAATPFQMAVVVDVPSSAPLVATGHPAANKKAARQSAARALFESVRFKCLYEGSLGQAGSQSQSQSAAVNPVSRLNEATQKWQVDRPVYEERARDGPPHAMRFTMQVTVTMPGTPGMPGMPGREQRRHTAVGGAAPSLSHARQSAASAMLMLLSCGNRES